MIQISAFKWVPPFAQGVVRDLRVRWALEEAGLKYEAKLLEGKDLKTPEYCESQPFGQVPIYKDDEVSLFESGAIVLHIAEKSDVLMPKAKEGRARTTGWVISALNSIEPFVMNLVVIDIFARDQQWAQLGRSHAVDQIRGRLSALNKWMDGRDYLEKEFTAGDLIMTTVLRNLRHTDILATEFPALDKYRMRCEARPAFKRALDAQMKPFIENSEKIGK